MKITRKAIFELDHEDLASIEELVIVLNPGNGIEPVVLNFDDQFRLVGNLDLIKKSEIANVNVQEILESAPARNSGKSLEETMLERIEVFPEGEESVGEPFVNHVISINYDFLPPVSACEKEFPFRNTKIVPYNMSVSHDTLESFIKRFIYNKNIKKSFEEKIYEFFIGNELGRKFELKTINAWCAGLWMVMDPYGFKSACGGKITFRAIEFAFRDIRKQLEERVVVTNGRLPKVIIPVIEDKRKTRYKKTS